VTGVDMEGPDPDGITVIDVRGSNCSSGTDPLAVDQEGNVTESLVDEIPEGSRLIGCFTFAPAG